MENVGPRFAFEEPFWSGRHPATDEGEEQRYPLPFHPLELGEVVLKEFFGYQLEGFLDRPSLEPESIPLLKYKRKGRWKLW